VIAEPTRDLRFPHGLFGPADDAGDHDDRTVRPFLGAAHGKLEHRLIEPRLTDGELRGVNADRKSSGSGVEIVPAQCPLPARIESTLRIERQRMRRDDGSLSQRGEHLRGPVGDAQTHRSDLKVPEFLSNQPVTRARLTANGYPVNLKRITGGSRSG
jgi:hypothetical protein